MTPPATPLKANPAERSAPAPRRSWLADRNGYLAVLAVGLVYAGLLSLLWWGRDPAPEPEPESTPVEIVTEPPPPPPPKAESPAPTPEPPKVAPPLDEPPATDAPRAGKEEDKPTEAPAEPVKPAEPAEAAAEPAKPAAEPPPKPPSPAPAPGETGGPKQEGAPQAKDAAAEPADDRPGEVLRPAGETKDEKPDAPQKRTEAEAPPANPEGYPATALAPMPDADFAAYAKRTPFNGGANATYLTTLYGMIVPRLHAPASAQGRSQKREGTIEFSVDSKGNLLERRILSPSGSRELDAAALSAVAEAAPFPPPPYGGPIGLTFSYAAD